MGRDKIIKPLVLPATGGEPNILSFHVDDACVKVGKPRGVRSLLAALAWASTPNARDAMEL